MHGTKVVLKDGAILNGQIWTVRAIEGWFTMLIDGEDKDQKIQISDCGSVTTFGERISKNEVGDQDMLEVWAKRADEERAILRRKEYVFDETDKGVDRHGNERMLGGNASTASGPAHYIFCSRCSPEPLTYPTAVIMKVRKVGWPMKKDGMEIGVDVIECPVCHAQILR